MEPFFPDPAIYQATGGRSELSRCKLSSKGMVLLLPFVLFSTAQAKACTKIYDGGLRLDPPLDHLYQLAMEEPCIAEEALG